MARLIVTDKPSVARDLARLLNARRREEACYKGPTHWVTWCPERMVELCEPGDYKAEWRQWSRELLPILPESFQVRVAEDHRRHFNALVQLMGSAEVEAVINACDAGREGELAFRYLYEQAGCTLPVLRLWLSSLTDKAIVAGMQNLQSADRFDALSDAARCRSEADWLVGINATRAMTLLGRSQGAWGELFSVGRVQTPTLAMVVEREEAIEAFEPRDYWTVNATFEAAAGRFEGRLEINGEPQLYAEQLAEDALQACRGQAARAVRVRTRQERQRPPQLFDLTTLQRVANTKYGLTGQQTLDAAEQLYETHKLITWPRSETNVLPAAMVAHLPQCIKALRFGLYEPACDALLAALPLQINFEVVEQLEMADHHAIIPTGRVPKDADLSEVEQQIFDLILRRFLASFHPDAVVEVTAAELRVGDYAFTSEARRPVSAGWHSVESPMKLHEDEAAAFTRAPLPALQQGEALQVVEVQAAEHSTQPPRRHTEASLLGALQSAGRALDNPAERNALMESGLGTPATRASVIDRLIERGYLVRDGAALAPSAAGRALVASIPVEELRCAELTGRWEARLSEIAAGRLAPDTFRAEVRAFVQRLVPQILDNPEAELGTGDATPAQVLGNCPLCKTPVTEGLKAYSCASGRSCSFVIFKTIAQREISPSLVSVLLTRGQTKELRGFVSRKGADFAARLLLTAEGKVQFGFDDSEGEESDAAPATTGRPALPGAVVTAPGARARALLATPVPTQRSLPGQAVRVPSAAPRTAPLPAQPVVRSSATPCPCCHKGYVVRGRKGWGCSRWREGCRFVVWFDQHGRALPEAQAHKLFRSGATDVLNGFTTPNGVPCAGRLVLDLDAPSFLRLEQSHEVRVAAPLQPELF